MIRRTFPMKKWLVLASMAVLAFAAGYLLTSISRSSALSNERSSLHSAKDSPIAMAPTPVGVPALWASSASTIAELVAEADLVIRARAIKGPEPRVVSFHGPIMTEDGRTVIGEAVDEVTFSDTEMEVIEIYKGSAGKLITVMQTGGVAGDTGQHFWLEGEPLYVEGEEVILFLVDVSNDPIHAQGRTLYRIVNPAGRYTIQGSEVLNWAEFSSPVTLPKTVDELVRQIREAVK